MCIPVLDVLPRMFSLRTNWGPEIESHSLRHTYTHLIHQDLDLKLAEYPISTKWLWGTPAMYKNLLPNIKNFVYLVSLIACTEDIPNPALGVIY